MYEVQHVSASVCVMKCCHYTHYTWILGFKSQWPNTTTTINNNINDNNDDNNINSKQRLTSSWYGPIHLAKQKNIRSQQQNILFNMGAFCLLKWKLLKRNEQVHVQLLSCRFLWFPGLLPHSNPIIIRFMWSPAVLIELLFKCILLENTEYMP